MTSYEPSSAAADMADAVSGDDVADNDGDGSACLDDVPIIMFFKNTKQVVCVSLALTTGSLAAFGEAYTPKRTQFACDPQLHARVSRRSNQAMASFRKMRSFWAASKDLIDCVV